MSYDNTGCTNLVKHSSVCLKDDFINQLTLFKKRKLGQDSSTTTDIFEIRTISAKARNIYGWLEQLVMNDRPFSFVENKFDTKYSKLEPISSKTLIHYCEAVGAKVEEAIRSKPTFVQSKRSSHAKLIMTPLRRNVTPHHLEILLLLRSNMDLWSASTIDEVIKDRLVMARSKRLQSSSSSSASIISTTEASTSDFVVVEELLG